MSAFEKAGYTKFGKLIKKKLIDRNMTATQLADTLGTTPQYLNKILHGERSGEKYIQAIIEIKVPKAVKGLKVNSAKKSLKLSWKKSSDASGYEIQYSLNRKFKNLKKITIKKASKTKYTIKGLKKKKNYYVRIRAYKKIGSAKMYSNWKKALKKTK